MIPSASDQVCSEIMYCCDCSSLYVLILGIPMGQVMWEVFMRREAWHWLSKDAKQYAIMDRVCFGGKRPKIPRSLDSRGFTADGQNHESISEMIRKCLHHDPSYRPSAKRLKDWLGKCRARLQWSIDYRKRMQETERSQLRRETRSSSTATSVSGQEEWSVVDSTCSENWNHGRYSVDAFNAFPDDAKFTLTIHNHTRDDWEENALVGDQKEPVPSEPNLQRVPTEPLGIIFDEWPTVSRTVKKDKHKVNTLASNFPELTSGCTLKQINGEDAPASLEISAVFQTEGDLGVVFGVWPTVKKIRPDTMASHIPGLHVGCTLLSIDSVPAGNMTFEEAKVLTKKRPCAMRFSPKDPMQAIPQLFPQLFSRPLTLTFSSKPTAATMDVLAPWHVVGMRCVGEVRAHEARRGMSTELAAANAEIAELKKQLARIELVSEGKPLPDAAMGVGND